VTAHLAVERLDHHYGGAQSLRGVSLSIRQGECLALLGRNGAGKSTLLRCLAGLLRPSAGRILLDGADIGGWAGHRRCRGGIGYVPQGREIFSDLSVAENLVIAFRAQGGASGRAQSGAGGQARGRAGQGEAPRAGEQAVLDEVFALFPVLRDMGRRRGGDLSGGQQQQLAIGRALMGRPRLLVLDEPTEGIQPSVVKAIEAAITTLKGRMSILLVEQYLDFAAALADRYVVLSRGAVVAQGLGPDIRRDGLDRFLSV